MVDGGSDRKEGEIQGVMLRVSSWGNENVIRLTVNTLKTLNSTL